MKNNTIIAEVRTCFIATLSTSGEAGLLRLGLVAYKFNINGGIFFMGKENIVGDLHAVNQKSSNLKMFKVGKQWVLASKVITLFGTAVNSDSFEMDDTELQRSQKIDGVTRMASYHY